MKLSLSEVLVPCVLGVTITTVIAEITDWYNTFYGAALGVVWGLAALLSHRILNILAGNKHEWTEDVYLEFIADGIWFFVFSSGALITLFLVLPGLSFFGVLLYLKIRYFSRRWQV